MTVAPACAGKQLAWLVRRFFGNCTDCPKSDGKGAQGRSVLSLCGHLEQLERTAEPEDDPSVSLAAASSAQGTPFGCPFRGAKIERQLLRGGIRTVQAVLYALQETQSETKEIN